MFLRKKYTREFKIRAIELAELKREMDQDKQTCFPENGQINLSDQDLELKRLQ